MPKITKRLVESLNATDRDVFAWDDELRGFGVRVKPSGVRTHTSFSIATRKVARDGLPSVSMAA